MPAGAKPLTVQNQHGVPCLWAEVDPSAEKIERRFALFGTGHEMPADGLSYIGTFQMRSGALVFHLYEVLQ